MSKRRWKIQRRGDHYKRPENGPVRVIAANGLYFDKPLLVEMRPNEPRLAQEFDARVRRMSDTIAHRLPVDDVERRIKSLRIRL